MPQGPSAGVALVVSATTVGALREDAHALRDDAGGLVDDIPPVIVVRGEPVSRGDDGSRLEYALPPLPSSRPDRADGLIGVNAPRERSADDRRSRPAPDGRERRVPIHPRRSSVTESRERRHDEQTFLRETIMNSGRFTGPRPVDSIGGPPEKPARYGSGGRAVSSRWSALAVVMATVVWLSPLARAQNLSVDLKLLVVSTGTAAEDIGLDYIDDILDEMDVPYEVLDSSRETLTAARLSDGTATGYFNGVILTSTDLFTPAGSGFTAAEWTLLHDFERDFQVRESVLAGWPGTYPDLGVDYGMNGALAGSAFTARWLVPAGGTELFEYVNTANTLPITDFALSAIPRNDGVGPTVTPLLVDESNPGNTFVAKLDYPDGREVLLSTISNAWFLLHSQVLGYEFVNFASSGVFLGSRQVHLTAHLDDLFLPNDLWDPVQNVTDPFSTYRLAGADITDGVAAQAAFRSAHPTVDGDFKLDFPFNGSGAAPGDPLTDTVLNNRDAFRYINHTFTHADMDTPHPEYASCDYTTLDQMQIEREIVDNRRTWRDLGLPERQQNNRILLTGNHSGLKDRNCTDLAENSQSDDIPYLLGANPLFLAAAQKRGVRYIASDSSQANQDIEQYVPGYNLLLLPRYPTNVFVNVIEPDALTDEYNYVFHERFVNAGQDPCQIPGAVCTPRTYAEILEAEAVSATRHMLGYRKWSHFFHQSNLANYSSSGTPATLMFDWLDTVVARYEQLYTLPIVNLPFYEIGDQTRDRLAMRDATISARWDRVTDRVTYSADRTVRRVPITGVSGGSIYGGQSQRTVNVSTSPRSIRVDQALNR